MGPVLGVLAAATCMASGYDFDMATVAFVAFFLGFTVPVGVCLAFVALSAWLNVFLTIR